MNDHEKLGGKLQTGQVAPLTLGIYWFADSFSTLDSTPTCWPYSFKNGLLAEGLTDRTVGSPGQKSYLFPHCILPTKKCIHSTLQERERELRLGEFE